MDPHNSAATGAGPVEREAKGAEPERGTHSAKVREGNRHGLRRQWEGVCGETLRPEARGGDVTTKQVPLCPGAELRRGVRGVWCVVVPSVDVVQGTGAAARSTKAAWARAWRDAEVCTYRGQEGGGGWRGIHEGVHGRQRWRRWGAHKVWRGRRGNGQRRWGTHMKDGGGGAVGSETATAAGAETAKAAGAEMGTRPPPSVGTVGARGQRTQSTGTADTVGGGGGGGGVDRTAVAGAASAGQARKDGRHHVPLRRALRASKQPASPPFLQSALSLVGPPRSQHACEKVKRGTAADCDHDAVCCGANVKRDVETQYRLSKPARIQGVGVRARRRGARWRGGRLHEHEG
ncbi:hypothetical protein DFH07DRAFT_775971 [Mycena maculata]|uniref:Uncharacterized protein n=1 Tax=Mycena maculata TaxID=230809 RepID=A0AAD7IRE3_9AGAR|nr:hypothetical protein DFH07DRAFT_775971 [Mycena maculata]